MSAKFGIATKTSILVLAAILSTLLIVFLSSFFSLLDMKKTNQAELNRIIHEERREKLVELTDNASAVLETTNFNNYAIKAITAMRFGKQKRIIFLLLTTRAVLLFIRKDRIWWEPARWTFSPLMESIL